MKRGDVYDARLFPDRPRRTRHRRSSTCQSLERFKVPVFASHQICRALGERAVTAQLVTWRIEPIAGGATGAHIFRVSGDARVGSAQVASRAPADRPARLREDHHRTAPRGDGGPARSRGR